MLKQLFRLTLLIVMTVEMTSGQTRTSPAKLGHWSGDSAKVTVTKTSTEFDFGCGAGTAGRLRVDKHGAFRVSGTYTAGIGANPPAGMPPQEQSVFFVGTIKGSKMNLSIDYPNSERPSPTYELTAGTSTKDLPRCA